MILTFDVETSRLNFGNPYSAGRKLVSYSLQRDDGEPAFHYYDDIEFLKALRQAFQKATLIVGFNLKFDLAWAKNHGIEVPQGCRVWDCQIAEFLISGQTVTMPSLNGALARIGMEQKDTVLKEYYDQGMDTIDIPRELLATYNNKDVALTYKLYKHQLGEMSKQLQRLCIVQGLDLLTLLDMEYHGQLFDRERCEVLRGEVSKSLEVLLAELQGHSPYAGINWGSGYDLSAFLYGGYMDYDVVESQTTQVYKSGAKKGQEYVRTKWKTIGVVYPRLFEPLRNTKTEQVSKTSRGDFPVFQTSVPVLKQLKCSNKEQKRIIQTLLELSDQQKLLNTYYAALPALLDEMQWGDTLHPSYNQCVARTGRLSSSKPKPLGFSNRINSGEAQTG